MPPSFVVGIDATSSVPPFEQLRTGVATRVASGELPAGTRLPTVRGLADELGLAVNTVARAYRELEADGVVETRGRQGTFVRSTSAARDVDVSAAATAFTDAVRRAGLTRAEADRLLDEAWPR
jgi:DNA-binding transcriptional regulator YhcF (GntR family)